MSRVRIYLLAIVGLSACSRDETPAATRATPDAIPSTATPDDARAGGKVSGRITIDGTPPPRVTRTPKIDPDVCGAAPIVDREMLVDPATKGVRYAVVTLTNDTAAHATPSSVTREIEQAKCEYFPYITVVPPGSRIVVTNADDALHDVHVMPESGTETGVNHALRPDGRVELAFAERGNVLLGCDLHYWARAWVIVDAAPFAAVTDAEGRYAFPGVPPGVWRLTVWQERLGTAVREVTVQSPTAAVVEDVALPPPAPKRPNPP